MFSAVAALALPIFAVISPAQAATLTYSFDLGGIAFNQNYYDQTNINNSRIFVGGGYGNVVYDTVTQVLTMSITSVGNVYGAAINVDGIQDLDRTNVLVSNVVGTMNMTYTNITQETGPDGIFGLATKNATGTGTVTVSDIGLGGVTPVTYANMAMYMDFNDPNLVQAHREYADIQFLGAANYFQYVSTDPLSAFFNKLVFFSWTVSSSDVIVNGINYGKVHADSLGAVPEPASMILLGSALLGGLAARRKSTKV